MYPIVSVITPTWNRNSLLLERCIPSVEAQTYPYIEHVIVSDGPDPALLERDFSDMVTYDYLPEHVNGHIGNPARLWALEICHGSLIAYLDDDDAYRPDHIKLLVEALGSGEGYRWARSVMMSHKPSGSVNIGYGRAVYGNIGTPMIMHERSLLEIATWTDDGEQEDWELISKWLDAGFEPVCVDEVTVDVWPSNFHGGRP